MPVHIGIKRRERQPAEFHRIPVFVLLNNNVRPRFLVFQLNFIPDELDVLALRWIRRIRWNSEQPHFRAFLAPNHLHNFVQSHVAHIDELALTLSDGSNSVAYF